MTEQVQETRANVTKKSLQVVESNRILPVLRGAIYGWFRGEGLRLVQLRRYSLVHSKYDSHLRITVRTYPHSQINSTLQTKR